MASREGESKGKIKIEIKTPQREGAEGAEGEEGADGAEGEEKTFF